MKTLKNKKILASGLMLILAISMMASATYAWFVLDGKVGGTTYTAGKLGLAVNVEIDSDELDVKTPLEPGFFYGIDDLTKRYIDNDDPNANWGWGRDLRDDMTQKEIDAITWGSIKNDGDIILIAKLSQDSKLDVQRHYKYDDNSTSINDNVTHCDEYDGVPGAITYNMIIPNTTHNKEVFDNSNAWFYIQSKDKNGNARTDVDESEFAIYLAMQPDTYLDAATYIDMATNAGYNVKGPSNKHVADSLYLDNSYFGCTVTPTMHYLATQFRMGRAIADVFGLTYNPVQNNTFELEDYDITLDEPLIINLG
jgi:hypothetical protein